MLQLTPINIKSLYSLRSNATKDDKIDLEVVLRVPVRVVYDDSVGGSQVDSEATGTSAQQKHKPIRVRPRKPINCLLAHTASNPAVDPLIQIPITQHKNTSTSNITCIILSTFFCIKHNKYSTQ